MSDDIQNQTIRALTIEERALARWMLEHGTPEAERFIAQLDDADATTWRCKCGCASFNFRVRGKPPAPAGVHVLGDFVFGDAADLAGIFIFQNEGILSGVEVYGLAGDPPTQLPPASELRSMESTQALE